MKRPLVTFLALSLCAVACGRFEIQTPESKRADAAWERKLRRDFDFARLRDFLLHTLAEQKRFAEVELESSAVGDGWRVNHAERILSSGSWMFRRDKKGPGFELRHYPGEGDREVVLVCERKSRKEFRLVEVRWGSVTVFLALDRRAGPGAPASAYARQLQRSRATCATDARLILDVRDPMTREEFWQLIDATRPKGFWAAMHSGFVELKLETLPEEEIISFDRHFWQVMGESYRWDLWGAAYIVNGGCSDDGFAYFRAWLISQGKRYYEKCLRDPEAVGARAERDGTTEDEEFMYCAAEAYREKTGRELPPADVPGATQPAGQPWTEGDLPKLYPKLAKRFGFLSPD